MILLATPRISMKGFVSMKNLDDFHMFVKMLGVIYIVNVSVLVVMSVVSFFADFVCACLELKCNLDIN